MDSLKKLFPLSWSYTKGVGNLIVGILLYVLVGIVAGALIWLAGFVTGWIPVLGMLVGWVLRVIGILVDVYVIAGIVLQILVFCKVI